MAELKALVTEHKPSTTFVDLAQQSLSAMVPSVISPPVTGAVFGICSNGETTAPVTLRGEQIKKAADKVEALCAQSTATGADPLPNIDRLYMLTKKRPDGRHDMDIKSRCVRGEDVLDIKGHPDAEIAAPLPTPEAARAMAKEIETQCQGQGA